MSYITYIDAELLCYPRILSLPFPPKPLTLHMNFPRLVPGESSPSSRAWRKFPLVPCLEKVSP